MELLTERHTDEIAGVLSCYDRILIQGTLPGLCYAEGMTAYLKARQIRIFDYAQFAQPLRDALRENAERLAAEHGLEILRVKVKGHARNGRGAESLPGGNVRAGKNGFHGERIQLIDVHS